MSIASETGTITLGGRTFDVSAFTLDQLQNFMQLFDGIAKPLKEGGFAAYRAIVAEAIKDQIAPDELAELRTDFVELIKAGGVITRTSGLVALGELMAAMASTGMIFTPASPPIPAGPGMPSAG